MPQVASAAVPVTGKSADSVSPASRIWLPTTTAALTTSYSTPPMNVVQFVVPFGAIAATKPSLKPALARTGVRPFSTDE